jgi:hypothetical protein
MIECGPDPSSGALASTGAMRSARPSASDARNDTIDESGRQDR